MFMVDVLPLVLAHRLIVPIINIRNEFEFVGVIDILVWEVVWLFWLWCLSESWREIDLIRRLCIKLILKLGVLMGRQPLCTSLKGKATIFWCTSKEEDRALEMILAVLFKAAIKEASTTWEAVSTSLSKTLSRAFCPTIQTEISLQTGQKLFSCTAMEPSTKVTPKIPSGTKMDSYISGGLSTLAPT